MKKVKSIKVIVSNSELLKRAYIAMSEVWGKTAIFMFVYFVFIMVINFLINKDIYTLISFIMSGPISLGITKISLAIYRQNKFDPKLIFWGIEPKRFFIALVTEFLRFILVIIGFSMLIVPGIFLAMAFSQSLILIADNKATDPLDALKKSYLLMAGNKKQYFYFLIKLAFYSLLCVITFGIGYFWYFPFYSVAIVVFYEELLHREVPARITAISNSTIEIKKNIKQQNLEEEKNYSYKGPKYIGIDVNIVFFVILILIVIWYLLMPK